MFNVIHICSFIPVGGCVGIGAPMHYFPRVYNAVKMALSDIDDKSSNIRTSNVNILQAFRVGQLAETDGHTNRGDFFLSII